MDEQMNEPSVLDYLKSKIFFWRGIKIDIPQPAEGITVEGLQDDSVESSEAYPDIVEQPSTETVEAGVRFGGLWDILSVMLMLTLGLLGQLALEPPGRNQSLGVAFYVFALAGLIYLSLKKGFRLAEAQPVSRQVDSLQIYIPSLWVTIILGLIAFLAFGGNQFNMLNILLWLGTLLAFLRTFWVFETNIKGYIARFKVWVGEIYRRGIRISPWIMLLIGVLGIAAFFRFYRLASVPAEMFSDHAEKLYDVMDVLDGQWRIFFPRNTGREAFQFYLTVAMIKIFRTGISFLSLKLGTTIAGLLTLPFIYLLGKELANCRVGILAMAFAGIAYWHNVIARVALRFALYPFFAAPALYFLVRGLRRQRRNDFILSGIFVGLGLHGYSPGRFVPILVVIVVSLYLLHRSSEGWRKQTVIALGLLALTALVVFLPLMRYWIENPDMFSYRALTRMTSIEHPIPGPVWQVFAENFWRASTMFFWDNGEIWVHSVPHRPALDVVSAVFYFIGVVLLVIRYIRKRIFEDLFLLIAIPVLMMPSILSLAFPAENPSLNRTGAALIPVFIVVGLGIDALWQYLEDKIRQPWSGAVGFCVVAVLFLLSASQNYDLVFRQYDIQFRQGAWNTSELGKVIRLFADTIGDEDSAWVVPYPYWVDTRLVGINAGFPRRDYALWREQIVETTPDPRAKLFLFKEEDVETMQVLRDTYPQGMLSLYDSALDGKDFWVYLVPAEE